MGQVIAVCSRPGPRVHVAKDNLDRQNNRKEIKYPKKVRSQHSGSKQLQETVIENFELCDNLERKMTGPIRVILLGCGSYNPITNMHLRMFELARDALNRSGKYKVIGGIISPVNDGYNKKDLVSAKHRCSMVRAALKTSDWIKLDTWECEQDEWQETAKVVIHHRKHLESLCNIFLEDSCDNMSPSKKRRSNKRRPGKDDRCNSPLNIHHVVNDPNNPIQVKLLCGADMLESFGVPGLWSETDIEDILRGGLVCITRSGSNPEQFIYESDLLTRHEHNIHIVREWIQNEISATKIRRSLRRSESVKYLLQDTVIQYVKEHNLYNKDGENKMVNGLSPAHEPFSRQNSYCYDEPCDLNLVPKPAPYLVSKYTQTHSPTKRASPKRGTSKTTTTATKTVMTSPKHYVITSPSSRRTHRAVYFSPSVEDEPNLVPDTADRHSRTLVGDSRSLETLSANTSGYQTSSSDPSPDKSELSPTRQREVYDSPSRKQITDINSVMKRIRRVTIAPETCL